MNRLWSMVLWGGFALLGACGGSGDGGGGTTPPPVSTVGQLTVTVAGLPSGAQANVSVTGVTNSVTVTASTTLSSLTPGRYTLAAGNLSASGTVYAPQTTTQDVTVTAGATSSATVNYAVARIALQSVATNLSSPLLVTAPAGDGRLFIVERPGRIRIVKNGTLLATPFIDIAALVGTAGEGGLLSMAFDPAYATNGFFYVDFTDRSGNIAVERFHVSANTDVADASPLRILSIAHPVNTNHYGGLVAFGPDGFLYVGVGDGGGAGDVPGNAQNQNVLLGKLVRLDVRNASLVQPYAIPTDNPFATSNTQRLEIWAYGLRNPWRYALDPTTSQLYIGDVGQDRREEIDVVSSAAGGINFGWNVVEGTLCYPGDPCNKAGTTLPVLDYPHDASGGCSITGGYVYRGAAIAALKGRYVYSDYCSGFLRSILVVNGVATESIDWSIVNVGQIVSFGQDAAGELYMVSANNTVYRLVAT